MLTPVRPWLCRSVPADMVAELENDLRVAPITARLLALRGVQGARQAASFVGKHLQDLHKPELMRDMAGAAIRLAHAINHRERILIHGDYDVDGSTSVALLTLFVQACSHQAIPWIPHRRIDGYGLSEASLQAVVEHHAQLMITVDCGIADHGYARRIEQETGCAVIITDHHLPQGTLPQCTAVCNPNHPECTYPDKHLAGVGVAWKLAWATAKVLSGGERVTDRLRAFLLDSLSLVGVGTVADCAALQGENRILVHHGLLALGKTANRGLRALCGHLRLNEAITALDIGWKLGPLLNASGRVGSAMANIRLLTASDEAHAKDALALIITENEERKRLTQLLTTELMMEVERNPLYQTRATLVFSSSAWHAGVVGIVASRLVEAFGKPSCVIAIQDGVGKGSLRSVPLVHLGDAIDSCRSHLIKGGGHAMAAGVSVLPENITAFSSSFEQHVMGRLPGGVPLQRTEYDGDVRIADLDGDFFTSLDTLGPFGIANPEPILQVRDALFISKPRLFGKNGDHLAAALSDGGGGMREFLAWRAKQHFPDFSAGGCRFDFLVKPQTQRWRGVIQPKLIFVDGRTL